MREAGLKVCEDAAFNLLGKLPSRNKRAKTLLLGSHLDTVRDAVEQVSGAIRSSGHLARMAMSDPAGAWAQAWRTVGSIGRLTKDVRATDYSLRIVG